MTRTKDWFNGFSWAAGLVDFGDNRNQESTSEAMNGYYAIYLLGDAWKNDELRDFGRLLMATELRSVKKYWHMKADSDVYPEVMKNQKMIGILWDTKIDYGTWFGKNPCFIHGIQMLPFTPITEDYLPRDFIAEEYPIIE
jgi:endo-1,3(4)-beta-glucanase